MLFKDIAIIDENLDYREHQWVGVLDKTIDFIGSDAPADAARYGEEYDGAGKLLMSAMFMFSPVLSISIISFILPIVVLIFNSMLLSLIMKMIGFLSSSLTLRQNVKTA